MADSVFSGPQILYILVFVGRAFSRFCPFSLASKLCLVSWWILCKRVSCLPPAFKEICYSLDPGLFLFLLSGLGGFFFAFSLASVGIHLCAGHNRIFHHSTSVLNLLLHRGIWNRYGFATFPYRWPLLFMYASLMKALSSLLLCSQSFSLGLWRRPVSRGKLHLCLLL